MTNEKRQAGAPQHEKDPLRRSIIGDVIRTTDAAIWNLYPMVQSPTQAAEPQPAIQPEVVPGGMYDALDPNRQIYRSPGTLAVDSTIRAQGAAPAEANDGGYGLAA